MNDQALVIGIKKYLHTNGYNSNNRGGRQQHSHVCRVRRTMLEEQIRAIITSPQVLVYQRDNGGRVRCPPVITSGTIAEFRSVFVYNLKKTCDPSLSIITSPNGLVATVYIWCRKELLVQCPSPTYPKPSQPTHPHPPLLIHPPRHLQDPHHSWSVSHQAAKMPHATATLR